MIVYAIHAKRATYCNYDFSGIPFIVKKNNKIKNTVGTHNMQLQVEIRRF
jgi:hypothetical protein